MTVGRSISPAAAAAGEYTKCSRAWNRTAGSLGASLQIIQNEYDIQGQQRFGQCNRFSLAGTQFLKSRIDQERRPLNIDPSGQLCAPGSNRSRRTSVLQLAKNRPAGRGRW
jgi:hypothetical protein